MSSQGSSSVRVFSGAAFAGDPLSNEVSTPSISFTESVPEVASHLGEKGSQDLHASWHPPQVVWTKRKERKRWKLVAQTSDLRSLQKTQCELLLVMILRF